LGTSKRGWTVAGKRRGRGEGSIEELPSGKWRVVVSAGFEPPTEEEEAAGKVRGRRAAL
jgi:hypothetical protein